MSHPNNDTYLEYAKTEFESATTREEREGVVQRLRDEGFTAQANYLEQFVEEGVVDQSDEMLSSERPQPKPQGHVEDENYH